MRLFIAEQQETTGRRALIRRMQRLTGEKTMQQFVLMDEIRDLADGMAKLGRLPDEVPPAAAPARQRKERPAGTGLLYDRNTLYWLIDMAPHRWTNKQLADAMTDIAKVEGRRVKNPPSVSWVGKQRNLYRPRRKPTCP
jgi:hypothetical protein